MSGKPFDLKRHLPSVAFVLAFAVLVAALGGIVIYAGIYNIGADAPHTRLVYSLIETARDRSIEVRARNIKPPADLDSAARVSAGVGLYNEMCTSCHLAPGMEKTEISQGLYPQAPLLDDAAGDPPGQIFWTIKHGVKMSGMAAWGKTHDDDLIWDMVAFIRTLPKLTPEQYAAAVASAPKDHDDMMADMPGMTPTPAK